MFIRSLHRRQFLIGASALLSAPSVARAQQPAKIHRIGYLSAASEPTAPSAAGFGSNSPVAALAEGLRELGYTEGRNLVLEPRFAAGSVDQLDRLASELVRIKVDLIVASATPAAQAARKATSTIPIIFVAVVDPVGAGLVASLARPGGNVTGLSMLAAELSAKRLELLSELLPRLSRIAILSNPTNASNTLQLREVEVAARTLGVRLQRLEVKEAQHLEKAFEAAVKERASALLALDDPFLFTERAHIASLATKHRLPAISGFGESADAGVLVSYGLNLSGHFRRAASYVDKIFKGARPADLAVEQPAKFELVINLKTAKTLGLTIPQSVLLRADRVIE